MKPIIQTLILASTMGIVGVVIDQHLKSKKKLEQESEKKPIQMTGFDNGQLIITCANVE